MEQQYGPLLRGCQLFEYVGARYTPAQLHGTLLKKYPKHKTKSAVHLLFPTAKFELCSDMILRTPRSDIWSDHFSKLHQYLERLVAMYRQTILLEYLYNEYKSANYPLLTEDERTRFIEETVNEIVSRLETHDYDTVLEECGLHFKKVLQWYFSVGLVPKYEDANVQAPAGSDYFSHVRYSHAKNPVYEYEDACREVVITLHEGRYSAFSFCGGKNKGRVYLSFFSPEEERLPYHGQHLSLASSMLFSELRLNHARRINAFQLIKQLQQTNLVVSTVDPTLANSYGGVIEERTKYEWWKYTKDVGELPARFKKRLTRGLHQPAEEMRDDYEIWSSGIADKLKTAKDVVNKAQRLNEINAEVNVMKLQEAMGVNVSGAYVADEDVVDMRAIKKIIAQSDPAQSEPPVVYHGTLPIGSGPMLDGSQLPQRDGAEGTEPQRAAADMSVQYSDMRHQIKRINGIVRDYHRYLLRVYGQLNKAEEENAKLQLGEEAATHSLAKLSKAYELVLKEYNRLYVDYQRSDDDKGKLSKLFAELLQRSQISEERRAQYLTALIDGIDGKLLAAGRPAVNVAPLSNREKAVDNTIVNMCNNLIKYLLDKPQHSRDNLTFSNVMAACYVFPCPVFDKVETLEQLQTQNAWLPRMDLGDEVTVAFNAYRKRFTAETESPLEITTHDNIRMIDINPQIKVPATLQRFDNYLSAQNLDGPPGVKHQLTGGSMAGRGAGGRGKLPEGRKFLNMQFQSSNNVDVLVDQNRDAWDNKIDTLFDTTDPQITYTGQKTNKLTGGSAKLHFLSYFKTMIRRSPNYSLIMASINHLENLSVNDSTSNRPLVDYKQSIKIFIDGLTPLPLEDILPPDAKRQKTK